jgi:hypothetical protein
MPGHRYIFIGGLHRSGTSLLARLIGAHPQIAAISDAPVPENEGCYLTGAIPHTARHGIPGHFATDPAQHYVEGCSLDRMDTRQRIEADWGPWYDADAHWRVEKSPVNLTRTRLLQSLFPLSHFLIVVRNPRFVAAAMRKWSDAGDAALLRYWCEAHAIVLEDFAYLHHAMIVRYEDLVASQQRLMAAIWSFLDLAPCPVDPTVRDGNATYRDAPASPDCGPARTLGYWGSGEFKPAECIHHPLRAIRSRTVAFLEP